MAMADGKLYAYVLFYCPHGKPADWAQTDIWKSASQIPGVVVKQDDAGMEAQRFQVQTSGQTLLYNPAGKLLFAGGITAGRGHFGDNAGADTILACVNSGVSDLSSVPVFGCSIFDNVCKGVTNSGVRYSAVSSTSAR
jgi:hypothetical protein